MRLIHDEQRVIGQEIEQAVRALPLQAVAQMPRIVLDAGAGAGLAHHLHIEVGALPEALCLEQPPACLQELHAILELGLNRDQRTVQLLLRRDVMRRGEDRQLVAHGEDLTRERIEILDGLDGVAHELDACGDLLVGRLDIHDVAAHPEARASKVHVVARVLEVRELAQQDVAPPRLALLHGDRLPR